MPGAVPARPLFFPGTDLEWLAYWALTVPLKKKDGLDFSFQSGFFGGRSTFGGIIVDFIMIDGSRIGMDIQGEHWHYGQSEMIAEAILRRARMESYGWTLVFVDGDDIRSNPVYYVREALNGVDHSRVAA